MYQRRPQSVQAGWQLRDLTYSEYDTGDMRKFSENFIREEQEYLLSKLENANTPSQKKRYEQRLEVVEKVLEHRKIESFKWLTIWHIVAAVFHGLSFLVILIAFLVTGPKFESILTSDVLTNQTTVTVTEVSKYNLSWVLMFMPLITSVFHIYQAYLTSQYNDDNESWYTRDIQKGINVIRWIEYSITATLMTWIITQLSGITNIYLVFLLAVVGNVVLQWHGYFFELNMSQDQWIKRCSPMISGFVLFTGQWSILACYFFRTVSANGGAPWFVWVSFFGLLGTFLLFPLIQILYYYKTFVNDWYKYEFYFILLSLISKLLLDWTLFGAIFSEQN